MPAEILYIEDNPAEVFLLREAVRKLNQDVRLITAGDGEVALALLFESSLRPSVIVMDLDVPRIDGTQVFKAVKAHPELRTVPTVVFAEKAARGKIHLTGFAPDLSLTKPMDLDGYAAVAE